MNKEVERLLKVCLLKIQMVQTKCTNFSVGNNYNHMLTNGLLIMPSTSSGLEILSEVPPIILFWIMS